MKSFSVICPVYNEEEMIPYTAPSIYNIKPNEVIFILDRCTDRSQEIIESINKGYRKTILRLLHVREKSDYRFHTAFLRRKAYEMASNDIILNTAIDIKLDPRIAEYLGYLDQETKLIKFGFYDYPFNVQSLMRQIYSTFTSWKSNSGLYLFNKKAWMETENQEEVKVLESSEDTHLIKSIESKYKSRYFNTKSLHLRPTETEERDRIRGVAYRKVLKASSLRAFLTSMVMLKPQLFVAYMQSASNISKGEERECPARAASL